MAYASTIVSGAACLGVLMALISGIFLLILAAVKWVRPSGHVTPEGDASGFRFSGPRAHVTPDGCRMSQASVEKDSSSDSIHRVRSSLYEEELTRQKRLFVDSAYLLRSQVFQDSRTTENGFGSEFSGNAKDQSLESGGRNEMNGAEQHQMVGQEDSKNHDPGNDTVRIRERMENMVEAMIGGPLDGTTVGQLSTHSAYENENSTNEIDSNLQRLIKKIIDHAKNLPDIKEVSRSQRTPKDGVAENFDSKSYEDILATAILNKVIENFQSSSYKDSYSAVENPKPRVRHRRLKKNDDLKSDGDWSDTSRSDLLSLTIEEYIEEVTTALEMSEDERLELSDLEANTSRGIPFPESGRTVVEGTDDEISDVEEQSTTTELITSTNSWEENWLFQKKRLRSTPNAHHPVPVPMLVPNPSEDFRALVGGVDADDLSDMSDCSDSVLEELVTTEQKPEKEIKKKLERPHYSVVSTDNREQTAREGEPEKVKVILTHITEAAFYEKLRGQELRGDKKMENCNTEETEVKSTILETVEDVKLTLSRNRGQTSEDAVKCYFSSTDTTLSSTITNSESDLFEVNREKGMKSMSIDEDPVSLENEESTAQQRNPIEHFRVGITGESMSPRDPTEELDEIAAEKPLFTRNYCVNSSKDSSGMSLSIPDQVSGHFYKVFPPWGSRLSQSLHIIASQHFSQVFRTSALVPERPSNTSERLRHSSHSLRLRTPANVFLQRKTSLQQELSYFEQQSLRENLTHTLLRAKDASPNFTLNPVFDPCQDVDVFHVSSPALPYQEHGEGEAMAKEKEGGGDGTGGGASQESGYGSDSLDHSSDSLESWRLTPPKTPEVIESSFVSIPSSRKTRQKRKSLSGLF